MDNPFTGQPWTREQALWALLGGTGVVAGAVLLLRPRETATGVRTIARETQAQAEAAYVEMEPTIVRAEQAVRETAERVEEAVEDLLPDWIPTLLRKTSKHEGKYWSVQRNLDGNGVSYGILQWTQKGGALGTLLREMQRMDPAAFAEIFGPSWASLLDVTRRASMEPVDGVLLWKEPWVSRFEEAGRYEPFQRAQDALAASGEHMQGAIAIARLLGVTTERALTLTYNRAVHQGPAGAMAPARALVGWYAQDPSRRPANPNDVLAQYAWKAAQQFRRASRPADLRYNDTIWWNPVASESDLAADGTYALTRRASPGVHHALTGMGKKPLDLYENILGRSSDILRDPELRDAPVDLAVAARPLTGRPVVSGLGAVLPVRSLLAALAPRARLAVRG
jgi:predicted lipoprotein with Yx(FWY)xxD motif